MAPLSQLDSYVCVSSFFIFFVRFFFYFRAFLLSYIFLLWSDFCVHVLVFWFFFVICFRACFFMIFVFSSFFVSSCVVSHSMCEQSWTCYNFHGFCVSFMLFVFVGVVHVVCCGSTCLCATLLL